MQSTKNLNILPRLAAGVPICHSPFVVFLAACSFAFWHSPVAFFTASSSRQGEPSLGRPCSPHYVTSLSPLFGPLPSSLHGPSLSPSPALIRLPWRAAYCRQAAPIWTPRHYPMLPLYLPLGRPLSHPLYGDLFGSIGLPHSPL